MQELEEKLSVKMKESLLRFNIYHEECLQDNIYDNKELKNVEFFFYFYEILGSG